MERNGIEEHKCPRVPAHKHDNFKEHFEGALQSSSMTPYIFCPMRVGFKGRAGRAQAGHSLV